MGKIKTVHYAIDTIIKLACGTEMFRKHKCPKCGVIKSGPSLRATFTKQKVTCGNCKRTKVFKSRGKIKVEPLSDFDRDIKYDL